MNDITTRIENIMSRVIEWADNQEVCDCEADAREFVINCVLKGNMNDDEIVEDAIEVWLEAE